MRAFARLTLDEVYRGLGSSWVLVGVVLLSFGGWSAIRIGQRQFAEQRATYIELVQARFQSQQDAGFATGRSAEPGLRVIRPPNAGTILVQGHDRSLPAAWEFTPAGVEAMSPYSTGPGRLGSGWDLELLTRLFGSLLAFGFGLAGVMTDRTSGWIGAVRGLPMPAVISSLTRVVGGCCTLTVVAAVWWVAMSAGVLVDGLGTTSLWHLWPLALPGLISFWLFFGLGTACAWSVRTDSRTALVGLTIWVGAAILTPEAATAIAEMSVAVAPQVRMERERREQHAEAMRMAEQTVADRLSKRLPSGLPASQIDAPAMDEFSQVEPEWQELSRAVRVAGLTLEDHWMGQVHAQQLVARWAAWLSPGALVRDVLAELAGTGPEENDAWELAVARQGTALNAALFDNRPVVRLRVPVRSETVLMSFDRHQAPKFSELPVFESPQRSLQARLLGAWNPISGLLLWMIGALGAAWALGVRALRE